MKLFILVCLYIQLAASWFSKKHIHHVYLPFWPTNQPPSPCSTIYYLVTAVGLFSGTFNFKPNVGTEGIHNALLSGQSKTHNPKHTDPVQTSTVTTQAPASDHAITQGAKQPLQTVLARKVTTQDKSWKQNNAENSA